MSYFNQMTGGNALGNSYINTPNNPFGQSARPQIDDNFMNASSNPMMMGGANPFNNQMNSNFGASGMIGAGGFQGMGGGDLGTSQANMGFGNANPFAQSAYQDPFTATSSRFGGHHDMGLNQMQLGAGNLNYNNPGMGGMPSYNQNQFMDPLAKSGYMQPFQMPNQGLTQQAYDPTTFRTGAPEQYSGPPNFSTLSPQQQNFLKQIVQFLVKYDMTLEEILTKDLKLPENATHISSKNLEFIGRSVRAEILEPVQIDDLALRIKDANLGFAVEDNLKIDTLKQYLSLTGIVLPLPKQKAPENPLFKALQVLQDYMKTSKIDKVETLFTGLTAQGATAEEILIEKEAFSKKLSEEVKISAEDLALITKAIETPVEGKLNIKKLEQELDNFTKQQKQTTLPLDIKQMSLEEAKNVVAKAFDHIKRFMAMNEINLVDVFREAERDDGYLDRGELSAAFERLSLSSSDTEHENRIQAFYTVFDPQRTLRIDYEFLLQALFQQANSKVVKDPKAKNFSIFEQCRQFMKQHHYPSIAQIFLTESYLISHRQLYDTVRKGQELSLDAKYFIEQLTMVVGIKELEKEMNKQSFIMAVMGKEYGKVNYHLFADSVGYEMPIHSNKEQIRRDFYRTLIKDVGEDRVESLKYSFSRSDIDLKGIVQLNYFINVIEGYSKDLGQDNASIIKLIAQDFQVPDEPYLINYNAFMVRVRAEVEKLQTLNKVFLAFNELLQFKDSFNLYSTLFARVDSTNEKRFTREKLVSILVTELGYPQDTAQHDAEQMFFEYDAGVNKTRFVKFTDIEHDYQQFVDTRRRLNQLPKVTNKPTILRMIKIYVDQTGKKLRQIFGKTKPKDVDWINQYQFKKILSTIADSQRTSIDDKYIQMFMNEISTQVAPTKQKTNADNAKNVSFSELLSLFNITFNVRDTDAESFLPFHIDMLKSYIASVALENSRNYFDLRKHFVVPASHIVQFIEDLKKEPLLCNRSHAATTLEEIAKAYQSRDKVVNTDHFIIDIEGRMDKIKQRNSILGELRKQVQRRNQKLEQVIAQALPDTHKFKIEYLSKKEFLNLFLFLEIKDVTEDMIGEVLQNFLQPDEQGKYSILEFIEEFNNLAKDQSQMAVSGNEPGQAPARRGRRLYQSREEILKRIAYVIEHRGLKTFGSLLADQDLEGKLMIPRDSFYRTIDSLQFALGEGDIQELIRFYAKGSELVDISKFKDDLNALIFNANFKIDLSSVLTNLIQERVVEQIDDDSPRTKASKKVDPKLLTLFKNLSKEIVCGLYVKETDAMTWFPKFSSFKKGSLTNKEFLLAIESLDATQAFENPESAVQLYFDNLLSRQGTNVGYSEQLLLLDQLNIMLYKDCPALTRQKMIEDILQAIAMHLTDNRLPLLDILQQFDSQKSGFIYKADFTTQFLDNYLKLALNIKTGSGLSLNQKLLLATKYLPNQQILQFSYEQFVADLRRKEVESRGVIHIYMTQKEVDQETLINEQERQAEEEMAQLEAGKPIIIELPAQSKKNTHVTEKTVTKPQLKGNITIASFLFDDIMMQTFRKGMSVEMFFRSYSRMAGQDMILTKEDFGRALASLGMEWANSVTKVSEVFDALDLASHGSTYLKYLAPSDVGEAVFLNAGHTIDDILSVHLLNIHKALKMRGTLSKLRDLFNFINTRRDNTCVAAEFKQILLEKLELGRQGIVKETHVDLLLKKYQQRHPVPGDESRFDFTLFLKDMEFCDQGLSPQLIWAIDLACNIIKALTVHGFQNADQLFVKYSSMQGIITFEEFRRAFQELQLMNYHPEEELRDFFAHIQQLAQSESGNQQQPGAVGYSKVSLQHLSATIKKLSPKNQTLITSDIFEHLWAETKKANLSLTTAKTAFAEIDKEKRGVVNFEEFEGVVENRLRVQSLSNLDLRVLAKRYRQVVHGEEMIAYDKFLMDYERFEQLGLRAGFDPLKDRQDAATKQASMQKAAGTRDLKPETEKLYKQTAGYLAQQRGGVERLVEGLVKRDGKAMRGVLNFEHLKEAFHECKMTFNTNQMRILVDPLPVDMLDNSYNYLVLLEFLFGRQKAQEVQAKYHLAGYMPNNTVQQPAQPARLTKQLDMSQRFQDQIEVKLTHLQNLVHQISKGSFILREDEFSKVFRHLGIVVTSQDHELLMQAFTSLRNKQTNAIDFRLFLKSYNISDATAQLITILQKAIAENNIRVPDSGDTSLFPGTSETVNFEDFSKFLSTWKIELPGFSAEQVKQCFSQLADRRERMEKSLLIKILRNERENTQQDWQQPYVVNELVYHIVNKNINLFRFVSPQAKKLTAAQFHVLLNDKLQFRTANSKDLPQLYQFFEIKEAQATENQQPFISIEKLLATIRKVHPNYALEKPQAQQAAQIAKNNQPAQAAADAPVKKLSQFTAKVKEVISKISEAVQRMGQSSQQVFERMDVNKNGIVERAEFLAYFEKDLQVKGLQFPQDAELLFEALDMNKDGLVSVNEFCLCLEGAKQTLEQRLRNFDPDLEKLLKDEIRLLFDFFDSNRDGSISSAELQTALRSSNPFLSQAEVAAIMTQTDRDQSQAIEYPEFEAVMLPQFKREMLSYENNFEDLRRLFKDCDKDQSNYLSKQEMREALLRLNIELTDVQLEELIREVDLDANGVIDIDEFIAFLSIADQVKFRSAHTKALVVRIKHARKLQPIDFYHCFKNLPQSFQPALTTELLEKRGSNTPSYGLAPQFDSRTMSYRDLAKLEEMANVPPKRFIELYQPQLACEIAIEEASGVPLPRKEDYDWNKIVNRELRIVLVDMRSQEFLSNTYICSMNWREDTPQKWLMNASDTHQYAKNLLLRTDVFSKHVALPKDIHLLFELVLFAQQHGNIQQVCCAWGSVPASQLDKQAKHKVTLKGGSPFAEAKINKEETYQEKKGFDFLKKLTTSSDEPSLTITVRPFVKLPEQSQLYISMLPSTCLLNRRLLSFLAAFRLFAYKKLTKAEQQLLAPAGNFALAQFRRIYDSPDVTLILADCWESLESSAGAKGLSIDQLMLKVEDFLVKLYAVVYSEEFRFDHVYPTRSNPVDSEIFLAREVAIKTQLAPQKLLKVKPAPKKAMAKPPAAQSKDNKENKAAEGNKQEELQAAMVEEYKPFNIAEMEVSLLGGYEVAEAKQDQLTSLYQQLGLLY